MPGRTTPIYCIPGNNLSYQSLVFKNQLWPLFKRTDVCVNWFLANLLLLKPKKKKKTFPTANQPRLGHDGFLFFIRCSAPKTGVLDNWASLWVRHVKAHKAKKCSIEIWYTSVWLVVVSNVDNGFFFFWKIKKKRVTNISYPGAYRFQ